MKIAVKGLRALLIQVVVKRYGYYTDVSGGLRALLIQVVVKPTGFEIEVVIGLRALLIQVVVKQKDTALYRASV